MAFEKNTVVYCSSRDTKFTKTLKSTRLENGFSLEQDERNKPFPSLSEENVALV